MKQRRCLCGSSAFWARQKKNEKIFKKLLTFRRKRAILIFAVELHKKRSELMGNCVTAAPTTLTRIVQVRILVPQPFKPPWSSGQDVALSRQNHGFDSHWRCHQIERFCSVFFKLSSPSVFIKSLYRILHLCQVFLRVPSFAFSMECAG